MAIRFSLSKIGRAELQGTIKTGTTRGATFWGTGYQAGKNEKQGKKRLEWPIRT